MSNEEQNAPQNNNVGSLLNKDMGKLLNDFFGFKINILPIIIKILYIISVIGWIAFCIYMGGSDSEQVLIWLVGIILGPFVLHIFFELSLLLFSILDILREIRNKLFDLENKSK